MAFSFGSTAAKPDGNIFGSAAKPAGGFAFGQTPASSTGGLFGSTNTSTASTGFGFSAPKTTSSSGSLFNFSTPATTASTGFGFGTGGGGGFGGTTTSSSGFGFGATATSASTFGGLGQPAGTTATAPTQDQEVINLNNMAAAISLPLIFADERDSLIAKWNQLQAFWGSGRGYYNQQAGFVTFTPENPFCRFKAVGYSCVPTTRNKDGHVVLVFGKPIADIQRNQQQIVDMLHRMLGGKPTLSVCVETVKALPDDTTEMVFYLQERSATGSTKRIAATDLFNFLNQQVHKTQLTTNLLVQKMSPKTGLSADALKTYLETAPSGIDPFIWRQAKLDNPDPEKLIPVPMVGFKELHNRLKHQQQQTQLQQDRVNIIFDDIKTLQKKQTTMASRNEEYKRKYLELSHRVLQVMVKQESYRKLGYAIQGDEEQLRVQLENLQRELNAPTQYKGRLNELMSQMRLQTQLCASRVDVSYQMEPAVQHEIQQHLRNQQDGIKVLMDLISEDVKDLQLITQGLMEPLPHHVR